VELKGKLNRKIVDGWIYNVPTVTTPIGSEGLYLESYDNDWEFERLENQEDERFFKPE